MFPTVFEWIWDMGHVIFMSIFWLVIIVLLIGIVTVLWKTAIDTNREAIESGDEWSETSARGRNPF
ncbi:MAG: hypothetical protein HN580_07995 [Deltaproteobacteria bacterium]|jgi:uncharacterized membrane protein|nr:hypothetical protein [Deltaproteobacteria bacterium]MBT4644289.1 hypothetical protein [Deltaproteobacteria bacterium]MBT6500357.1 hypothetical protein [Deltaproteobacteria bacterium]MBT6611111.1 hypothetical protein [Deltaproteobacteria bacterium]MBT7151120.1 hypothetical protein [Deltaproteobacteria bacterium]